MNFGRTTNTTKSPGQIRREEIAILKKWLEDYKGFAMAADNDVTRRMWLNAATDCAYKLGMLTYMPLTIKEH